MQETKIHKYVRLQWNNFYHSRKGDKERSLSNCSKRLESFDTYINLLIFTDAKLTKEIQGLKCISNEEILHCAKRNVFDYDRILVIRIWGFLIFINSCNQDHW